MKTPLSLQTHQGLAVAPTTLAALALLAALLLSAFRPAPQATPPPEEERPAPANGLSLQAEASFEGNFKYGEWLPIWVELENSGADLDGEVRVFVPSSPNANVFAVPVELPSGARKRLPVYVLPNNFSRELEVRFFQGEEELALSKVALRPQANITLMVGLVAPERGALSLISGVDAAGQQRPKTIVDLRVDDLPERPEGLRSFDLIVLNDVDTSALTPQQVRALEGWVTQGGQLIIGGGAGAVRTTAGLSTALLPLTPHGSQEVGSEDLSPLVDWLQQEPLNVPGPFLAATGQLSRGAGILAGSPEFPLVTEAALGTGKVQFVALDLATAPFEGWGSTTDFWAKLLGPGLAYPENMPPDVSPRQMRAGQIPYALGNLPVLDLPSTRVLAGLLGVYILLIGPVNYLVLRRMKRLQLAWVTIPALTLLFSAGAFAVGYALRGNDVVVNRIAILELQPNGAAHVNTYLGLFSPGDQSYSVQVMNDGLISPVTTYYDPWSQPSGPTGTEMVFVQGQPGEVRGLAVSQWSLQSFQTEATLPEVGRLVAELSLEGGVLKGKVRNETQFDIQDAVVTMARQFVKLGDLPAGGEVEVELPLNTTPTVNEMFGPPFSYRLFEAELNNPSGASRLAEVRRMIVESVFDQGFNWKILSSSRMPTVGDRSTMSSPAFLGWVDQAPPQVNVAGKTPTEQTTAMLYTALSYTLPENGPVVLPAGMLAGHLTEIPTNGGMCGSNESPAVYFGTGEAVFEFQAPVDLPGLQVEALPFLLQSDSGWMQPPEVAFFDWNSGWSVVSNPQQGMNKLTGASAYVSPEGLVRVRLSSTGAQGCYYVSLGLEGVRQTGQGGAQ